MCKPSAPPPPKQPEPTIITNPFDNGIRGTYAHVAAARAGRNSLRIPLASGISIAGSRQTKPKSRTAAGPTPASPSYTQMSPQVAGGSIVDPFRGLRIH